MEGLTLEVRFSESKGLINDNDYLMFADSEETLGIFIKKRRTYNIESKRPKQEKPAICNPSIHRPPVWTKFPPSEIHPYARV
ncbi:hypothetical protein BCON_0157g00050 [Botryotinia convoluta]|uniref:Uncharacterized protein n=1 Tax=Botryotinia convoluta TaxID=54673 RepID=A0A4Z1HS39_9HELO|nr:hypothetical protein BCON_0157g00050 [Botryotinia convoluta]